MNTILSSKKTLAGALMICALASFSAAQRFGRKPADRTEWPQWQIEEAFRDDVFTFARVQYDSAGGGFGRGGGGWRNDFPDCDWNFSARLQQLTSLEVDPDGKVVRLDDSKLFQHPFVYMSNCNSMSLSPDEAAGLRSYLLNGGFLMADDFWGPDSWSQNSAANGGSAARSPTR